MFLSAAQRITEALPKTKAAETQENRAWKYRKPDAKKPRKHLIYAASWKKSSATGGNRTHITGVGVLCSIR